ncbi:MAG: trigger factor, partial [Eubacteriales bacterium]
RDVDTVTDDQIDAEINRVRERNSRTTDIEDRPAAIGDTANIDYEGFKDGVPFEGGKGEGFDLKLGSGTFIPGFEDAIVGHSIGEEFDVNVTFPADYHAAELAGAPVVFKTKINGLKETVLPEFDDEFVKDVSEFDTVDDYKADVRAKLEKTASDKADNAVTEQVANALIEKLVADIPEVMFVNETENQVRDFDTRLQSQGLKLADYLKYMSLTLDDIRSRMRPQAEKQVKLRLALEKIAALEEIAVSDEEIEGEMKRLSETYSVDLDRVKALVDPEDVRNDLAADKALKLCKEAAVVTASETAEKAEEAQQ